ncbi:Tad domain-containing protein [Falsibacillus pallidus]|uniref:Putative Flp pilus-assembly TadE/G-like protein n=1 Tax=Falsibacillus pallidus TaxID=493781 RepID=A0A370G558_9BACI|nr:Tad domain-containing protein [Falsibacillus pallidus]RDI37949.1 putative Flp pilus-assembly TadE/G-like protein [Falsibacillus pallidus]
MKARISACLKEERGNAALFMIGMLGIMMVLFVFVFNLTKVFAVKEEAQTTTQQASLAATAVLYGGLDEAIKDYETTLIGTVDSLPESIEMKIDKKKVELQSDSSYSDYSNNEISLEAMDIVLTDELRHGIGNKKLDEVLEQHIRNEILPEMMKQARQTILDNHGKLTGAQLVIENGQVYVRASNKVSGTSIKGFFHNLTGDLFQTSGGPKVDFMEELDYFPHEIVRSLDY